MKTNTLNLDSKANALREVKVRRRNRVKLARANFMFCLSALLLLIEPIVVNASSFAEFSVNKKLISLSILALIFVVFYSSAIRIAKLSKGK